MTAEIIIMNKLAIAIAADSAVTYRETKGNLHRQKIYQTANKLFMLSKYQPVGIMVYGASEINGIPWEVVIKVFRNQLGNVSYGSLNEYFLSFSEFLRGYFSEEDQVQAIKNRLYPFYHFFIKEPIDKTVTEASNDPQTNPCDIQDAVKRLIDKKYDDFNKLDFIDGTTVDYLETFEKKHSTLVESIVNTTLANISLDGESLQKIKEMAGLFFTKNFFPNNTSGIVIAGYGESEHFPSFLNIAIDCVVDCALKCRIKNTYKVTNEQESIIQPFAIEDMVVTFIEGINPEYEKFLIDFVLQFSEGLPSTLLNKITGISDTDKQELQKNLIEESKIIRDDFLRELGKYKQEAHIDPILSAVNILPKDELADMAEMLVTLTSVKRRVSMEDEIVGGPIDVAVISKSDGFVWIKRKHYFDPNLNHHFFENYYNGCRKEETDD
ncbi:MAG: hypothetical protein GX432_11880 [Candidatus Atribacteria bacterium]|nr:hypothetical protein [Candidatus Atribacteria bacterium]